LRIHAIHQRNAVHFSQADRIHRINQAGESSFFSVRMRSSPVNISLKKQLHLPILRRSANTSYVSLSQQSPRINTGLDRPPSESSRHWDVPQKCVHHSTHLEEAVD